MIRIKYIGNKEPANSNIIINLETDPHGVPVRSVGLGEEINMTPYEFEYWGQRFILEKISISRPEVVESVNRTVKRAADRA